MQKILGYIRKAVQDFDLIQKGDRIAVGVSGGKDSLVLLAGLAQMRRFAEFDYDITAVTIDPGFNGVPNNYEAVARLCEKLDVPFSLVHTQIGEIVFDIRKEPNPCSLCANMRRGALHDAAKAAGISAVIAADVAVMSYARQIGQEVHLSTQLNISNAEALKFYAQFADVVVLARELNLEQVAEIYRQIREENICGPSGEQIRIEMFCHGALCMAVSGKCYLSLHEMNHSANRGACMQVCRRSYTVRDKETDVELDIDNEYIMSPKDLKTIHFMNKMMDAGVRVFKIEGRARGPEYVRTVVECYKEAIKAYLDDTFTDEKIAAWDERLKAVFNRGFWDGYYLGQRLGEWTRNYGSAATERKIYVGKGIKYFSNIGVSEFLVEAAEVSVGDKLLITGPTTGAVFMTLDEARVDLKPVETVKKGQRFSMKSEKIRPSDKLYKLVSTEELKKFKGLDVEQKRG